MTMSELSKLGTDKDVSQWASYFQFSAEGNMIDEATGATGITFSNRRINLPLI